MRQVNSRCEDVERDHVELLGKQASQAQEAFVQFLFSFVLMFFFSIFEKRTQARREKASPVPYWYRWPWPLPPCHARARASYSGGNGSGFQDTIWCQSACPRFPQPKQAKQAEAWRNTALTCDQSPPTPLPFAQYVPRNGIRTTFNRTLTLTLSHSSDENARFHSVEAGLKADLKLANEERGLLRSENEKLVAKVRYCTRAVR